MLEADADGEPHLSRQMVRKVVICLALLLALASLFEALGFIPSAILFALGMARLFGGRWLPSLVLAVILGFGMYLLFDKILDVPLPQGVLAPLEIF